LLSHRLGIGKCFDFHKDVSNSDLSLHNRVLPATDR
jgi:hypothetical protein